MELDSFNAIQKGSAVFLFHSQSSLAWLFAISSICSSGVLVRIEKSKSRHFLIICPRLTFATSSSVAMRA